jgi:carboxypeptidase Taq
VEEYGLPLSQAASLGIHESQSRLWENCIGRSHSYWQHFYPLLQQTFPEQLTKVSLQDFYNGINKVQPSLIRTEADEVTYHFHVLIRYEIEKRLIEGSLSVDDLPKYWNALYEQYLSVTAPDYKQGVLQDVHWSHGSFGYFPTYSLGSFYAVQFYNQALQDNPGLSEEIAKGNTTKLLVWLRDNIHCYGRRFTSEELCKRITGRGLDIEAFLSYATQKYALVYGFRE